MVTSVAVHCLDALDLLRMLPDSSIDLCATDPPYYRVKSAAWDRAWDSQAAFLDWLAAVVDEIARVLRPSGSLYLFASPQMSARVEVMISERLHVLNRITWAKQEGWARGTHKESLRSYFPTTESIIFAEHYGADNAAKGEAGYTSKCDEARGFVFEPLRAYLDGERRRAGVSHDDVRAAVGCAPGSGLPSHWFTSSQWMLPTAENYARLRALFNRSGGDEYLRREYEDLRREYEDLRREYEDLRREYEDLRRPFEVTAQDAYTDVWTFSTVPTRQGKHPCEKPAALCDQIVRASGKPGGWLLDPFAGSGAILAAGVRRGMSVIGGDADARWCDVARAACSTGGDKKKQRELW
jgi:site-specific DNA-methyltransferase (adenine-specific)